MDMGAFWGQIIFWGVVGGVIGLAMAIYVLVDSLTRGKRVAICILWSIVTLVFGLIPLIAWLIVRPETIEDKEAPTRHLPYS